MNTPMFLYSPMPEPLNSLNTGAGSTKDPYQASEPETSSKSGRPLPRQPKAAQIN